MCSTIRPLTLPHCFGRFQGNHVWKAPTSTFHQNLLLPGLLEPVLRSKGPKCARLSAPSLCATVVVGFKETMYGKPQPVPFTRTFFCQDCSNQFRDPRVQSVLDNLHAATGTTSELGWKHEWMPIGSSGAAAVHFSALNGNIYLPLSPPPQTQAQAEAVPCERPGPWPQGAQ